MCAQTDAKRTHMHIQTHMHLFQTVNSTPIRCLGLVRLGCR